MRKTCFKSVRSDDERIPRVCSRAAAAAAAATAGLGPGLLSRDHGFRGHIDLMGGRGSLRALDQEGGGSRRLLAACCLHPAVLVQQHTTTSTQRHPASTPWAPPIPSRGSVQISLDPPAGRRSRPCSSCWRRCFPPSSWCCVLQLLVLLPLNKNLSHTAGRNALRGENAQMIL